MLQQHETHFKRNDLKCYFSRSGECAFGYVRSGNTMVAFELELLDDGCGNPTIDVTWKIYEPKKSFNYYYNVNKKCEELVS